MGSAPLGFPNGDSIAEDKSSSCLFMSLLLPESQWMANNSVGKAPERREAPMEAMDGGFVTQTRRSLTTGREFTFG